MSAAQVQAWQRAIGVTADGDFGPATLARSLALLPDAPHVAPIRLPWVAEMQSVLGLQEVRERVSVEGLR